jgi:hypothetical protein
VASSALPGAGARERSDSGLLIAPLSDLQVGGGQSLGDYPRDWPADLSARNAGLFVRAARGISLADDG